MTYRITGLSPEPFQALFYLPEQDLAALGVIRCSVDSGMMIDAEVVAGTAIEAIIARMFADPQVGYIHVHHARQGCYCARIDRA
ncbi:DUF1203 domain-containing protein [Pseudomonas sp. TE3610]